MGERTSKIGWFADITDGKIYTGEEIKERFVTDFVKYLENDCQIRIGNDLVNNFLKKE